ncbi:putative cyclin-dependent kinase 9 [Aphelenchoides bicaudatus]|nr:putative cyclin-dependent kinase 9 [Aphelenchoides bicaudatus]
MAMNNGASTSNNRKRRAEHPSSLIAAVSESEPHSKYTIYMLNFIKKRMGIDMPPQQSSFRYPFIHDVVNYDKLLKIGQGTFGEVFKARCKKTQRFVALKKILMENEREGFPITAIREIKMLQRLRSDYITELIEICNTKCSKTQDKSTFYLVFTYCDFDLAGLLSHPNLNLKIQDIKCMMKHLLDGLFRIHSVNILHRDMKTANILVTNEGVLRLADFGLSRNMPKSNKPINYTNRVVTLWYRPPELLLGSRRYGPAIDLWGVGCIMAELWTHTPILQGDTEQKQLELIQNMCGGINTAVWPSVDQLPLFHKMALNPDKRRVLGDRMTAIIEKSRPLPENEALREQNIKAALQLIDQLLTLDPTQRIEANKALDEDFFFIDPPPPQNIRHVVEKMPKNIFEFTSGRGAHAGRNRNNMVRAGANNQNHQVANGTDRRARPYSKNPADTQMTDIVY